MVRQCLKILLKYLIVTLLLSVPFSSHSQSVIYPEINSFNGKFSFFELPTTGNYTISCFHKDKLGFLWIGTYATLYRFDGTDYVTVGKSTNDSTGFEGKIITGILEDNNGDLWIGTVGALNRYDPKNGLFSHFYPDTSDYMSADNEILYQILDNKGVIWLITGGDMFSFDTETYLFKRFPIKPENRPGRYQPYARDYGRILIDSCERIWFATRSGLYCHHPEDDTLYLYTHSDSDTESISGNNISFITEDYKGRIWVASANGGMDEIINPDSGRFKRAVLFTDDACKDRFDGISVILPGRDSSIWVFGNDAFGNYFPESGRFEYYILPATREYYPARNNAGLIFNNAWQTGIQDIWFMNRGLGMLFRFNTSSGKLILYPAPVYSTFHMLEAGPESIFLSGPSDRFMKLDLKNLPYQEIYFENTNDADKSDRNILLQDQSGTIWFTLPGGTFHNENFNSWNSFSLEKFSFPENKTSAYAVYSDRKGNLWFSMRNGSVIKYIPWTSSMKKYSLPDGRLSPVRNITEDFDGNMWFGDFNTLYILKKESESIQRFSNANEEFNSLVKSGIYDFLIDKNKRLWLALFDDGAYALDLESNELYHFPADTGLNIRSGDNCFRIAQDGHDRIWFLFSHNGLYTFDPEKKMLVNKSVDPGNPEANVYLNLFIDDKNIVWVGSPTGINLLNPESWKPRHISVNLGTNTCFFCQLKTGEVMMLAGQRLYLFPDTIPLNSSPPDIFITAIKVNNSDYNFLYPGLNDVRLINKIRLKPHENNIRIDFSAINYLDAENNLYRYYMKGIDKDTVNTTSNLRFSEYKNLRPGKYFFWFTGSNNDGFWNYEGKRIEIVITKPWFLSAIAIIIYLLIFLGAVAGFIKLRLYKLKREKRFLEEQVKQRTSDLIAKNNQIEELDRIKTRFFTEISHEIRTPLSLITGPIESLIHENNFLDNEKRIKLMEMIRRNGRRMMNLVNQLLDISRIDAGKMKITLIESDILNCLRILANEYLSLAESRKIRYILIIPDQSFFTYFDRDKTEKILSNLLSNAFKFTQSYGTILCKVEIENPEEQGMPYILKIIVKDNGVGINHENVEKIFDRFYRVEGQWDKDGTGSGIGLSITREFVSLLKGEINVQSEPGAGTLFEVTIPLGKEHLDKSEYIIPETHTADELNLSIYGDDRFSDSEDETNQNEKKLSLLVIEDNDDLRTFISQNLKSEYQIFEAGGGKEGISLAALKVPDLIITDIIMPDINGIEVCYKIKNDERLSHIPIIILTARTTHDDKIDGLKAGADDYLFKPFEMSELKIRIANLISQREKLRLKYGMLTGLENTENSKGSLDDLFMSKVLSIISENLKDFDFDVGGLQEKVGMSRVHLYRKIKAITGLSPGTLIRNMRMKAAAGLISRKAGNLARIAMTVGISNPSYFSKCFKDYYGVSPKDFNGKNFKHENF